MIGIDTALERIDAIKLKEAEAEAKKNTEEFDVIRIQKRFIPVGAKLIEAYETSSEIIILGDPPNDDGRPDEDQHNCDAMGCGSMGHVIYRFRKEHQGASK